VDDQRIGLIARAIRRKLGWRQVDVADRSGVAQSMVSLFERGHLEELSVRTIRRICAALDIRLDLVPRWRGVQVDRLLDDGTGPWSRRSCADWWRWVGRCAPR
jgi:transcriptional regulator with XRE-family HTH domain